MSALVAVLAAALLWAGSVAASSHADRPAGAVARETALLAKASPAVKVWVREEGQRMRKAGGVSEGAAVAAARARFGSIGGMGDGDIMALAFLVMMEAAKSAREDLKAVMDQVKSINAAKAQQRAPARMADTTATTQSTARMADSKAALKAHAALDKPKDQRDSLSEQGEEQQLRMQQVMDRMAKADAAVSNLMKKMSETQSSIIGNLK